MKSRINFGLLQRKYLSPETLLHLATFTALFLALYFINSGTYVYWFDSTPTRWQVYAKIVQINGTTCIAIINAIFLFLYISRIPFFEQFKVNSLEWPWVENPSKWKEIWPECVKTYIVNQMVLFPPFFLLVVYVFNTDITINTIPSAHRVLWQLFLCTATEDLLFYFSHRLLHQPFLYSRVHKKHHSFYNVFHMSAVYTHWFEFTIGNLIPLFSGAILLGPKMHIVSLVTFIMFRNIETHETHSGYEFPWSAFKIFPFSTDSAYHNYHHLKNIGNYSSFMIVWDTVFRTNQHYYREVESSMVAKTVIDK
jgi:sterol desaturase/sphingolipid hydroxylase (fatty acid hydroxylase superfamily)